ncbi:hypothetical protein AKJ54_00165 [candidate division MSBL1 archaeon SCGC-AAA382K21]|uniref:Uncharacterized protein n=1 Tax=candidate division MSBL1 archaeon SCGC-AAA382K21 TaxID=1698283 RepID=A0A133VM20_9EURY|nr:hypothetical protein AKJ54_00165 [candidate division MSBL1 archaeon SCGC-AAA382K21]
MSRQGCSFTGEEVVEKSLADLIEIADENEAERKEFAILGQEGEPKCRIKARMLIDGKWYVGEKGFSTTDNHVVGVGGCSIENLRFDEDGHPYWLVEYGNVKYRWYFFHMLGSQNKAGYMVAIVYDRVEKSEDMQWLMEEFREEWKERVKKHEKEVEAHRRKKYLDDISTDPSKEQEELPESGIYAFWKWFKEYHGDEYEEKVRSSRVMQKKAYEQWIRGFREELRNKGFKLVHDGVLDIYLGEYEYIRVESKASN